MDYNLDKYELIKNRLQLKRLTIHIGLTYKPFIFFKFF